MTGELTRSAITSAPPLLPDSTVKLGLQPEGPSAPNTPTLMESGKQDEWEEGENGGGAAKEDVKKINGEGDHRGCSNQQQGRAE